GEAKPAAGVVRLSIGLEHVDDLADDLLRALDVAALAAAPMTSDRRPFAAAAAD
ncbi:PLP-dependent transferase, partial [Agromyces mediolanus]|nr:PLP-dependent transferase [Agromyces mediolanus]